MSTLVLTLFATFVGIFLILLGVVAFLLASGRVFRSDSDQKTESCMTNEPAFSCAVEVVVLDEHLLITNTDKQQIRTDGSGLGRGLRLVTDDQLQLTLQPEVNVYRLFSLGTGDEETDDKQFLQIKVAQNFVEVKPVQKFVKQRLEVIIWKLKPDKAQSECQMAERQVFCGFLHKTVHCDRAQGRYFKFIVRTKGPQTREASLDCQSNILPVRHAQRHQLLTLRVEPERVMAANQSGLPMQAVVHQRSESLKQPLGPEMQDLPLNGTFSFSLLGAHPSISALKSPRKLLRLRLNERQLIIEPHCKLGSLPLSCEVFSPDHEGSDSPSQIVSGEFRAPLQLPRGPHGYIIAFHLHTGTGQSAADSRSQLYSK